MPFPEDLQRSLKVLGERHQRAASAAVGVRARGLAALWGRRDDLERRGVDMAATSGQDHSANRVARQRALDEPDLPVHATDPASSRGERVDPQRDRPLRTSGQLAFYPYILGFDSRTIPHLGVSA